jgi:hypothetical protein
MLLISWDVQIHLLPGFTNKEVGKQYTGPVTGFAMSANAPRACILSNFRSDISEGDRTASPVCLPVSHSTFTKPCERVVAAVRTTLHPSRTRFRSLNYSDAGVRHWT